MSSYFVKGKGWRFDFILEGTRFTGSWFKTKREAQKAEESKREEVINPLTVQQTPTDMGFLDLVNRRLDHVKAYNSVQHYQDTCYIARKWIKQWGLLTCNQISQEMIERFVMERSKVSKVTANKEIRYLRSLFNFGKKKKLIQGNPLDDIDFLPEEKRIKYVPSPEDIDMVISAAGPDDQDYLWVIRETLGRMNEINNLTWDDVDFKTKTVTLYTRKKKGGHLTPRKVPMTERLFKVLNRRYEKRNKDKPWVFWHRYKNGNNDWEEGPFKDRKKFMKTLCRKAGVKYFRFHALRHAGASLMDNCNVSIGTIQKILGHENRSTTEIYLHTLGNSERAAMTIYEKAREKSHTNSHTKIKSDDPVLAN